MLTATGTAPATTPASKADFAYRIGWEVSIERARTMEVCNSARDPSRKQGY